MSGLKVGVRLSPFTVRITMNLKQNNLFYVTVTKLKFRKFQTSPGGTGSASCLTVKLVAQCHLS